MTAPPTADAPRPGRALPQWSWFALAAILALTAWWRAHTFAPTLVDRAPDLRALWPVVDGRAEPLECDEALYGYMGRRLRDGDVLYRDLVENKPPLGYWCYALAIRIGGPGELAVRAMPIPAVLATVTLVWWIGAFLAGPWAACLAALLFALLVTDPHVHGNGANMEHFQNLFAVSSLAAFVAGWSAGRRGRAWFALAGLLLGAASLVKQVEATHGVVYAAALLLRRQGAVGPDRTRDRLLDLKALAAGCAAAWAAAVAVLLAQGAGPASYECIVGFGRATAAEIQAPPKAPPFPFRLIAGNSDPNTGALPWPFGTTGWVVWWGAGAWPTWLAMLPGLAWLIGGPGASGPRRLVGAWTLSAWVQVAAPGQFWQHYYMLPTPGAALAVSVLTADAFGRGRAARLDRRYAAVAGWWALGLVLIGSTFATMAIQVRDYLLVPPQQLSPRYKGGPQWLRNREIGEALAGRAGRWQGPRLFVWGWQSPLYFYSGMAPASRHLFVNDLVRDRADDRPPHPLVGPWIEEIVDGLRADPPPVIFTGYAPFQGLRAILAEGYRPSRLVPEAPVLWVRREDQPAFDAEDPRGRGRQVRPVASGEQRPDPTRRPRRRRRP